MGIDSGISGVKVREGREHGGFGLLEMVRMNGLGKEVDKWWMWDVNGV